MELELFEDPDSVARATSATIAADARAATAARGRFGLAVSGGHTWIMLRELANEDLPWAGMHIFQVDERVAPEGDPEPDPSARKLATASPAAPRANHAMPVECADLEAEKREMLHRPIEGDASIPAGRVRREQAAVLADRAAAGRPLNSR